MIFPLGFDCKKTLISVLRILLEMRQDVSTLAQCKLFVLRKFNWKNCIEEFLKFV